jgi:hypothetical protein
MWRDSLGDLQQGGAVARPHFDQVSGGRARELSSRARATTSALHINAFTLLRSSRE